MSVSNAGQLTQTRGDAVQEWLTLAKDFWTDWKELILLFVGGSGWITYIVKRTDTKRAKVREGAGRALEDFLIPLQIRLENNRRLHKTLTSDIELKRLEFAPDYVQQRFQSLPPDDARRVYWKLVVNNIFESNEVIIRLIRDKGFHILHDDLRKKCESFIEQAILWKSLWTSAFESNTPAQQGGDLLTPRFPESMDASLKAEIDHRMRQRESGRANTQ